jgi:hypothetical protein
MNTDLGGDGRGSVGGRKGGWSKFTTSRGTVHFNLLGVAHGDGADPSRSNTFFQGKRGQSCLIVPARVSNFFRSSCRIRSGGHGAPRSAVFRPLFLPFGLQRKSHWIPPNPTPDHRLSPERPSPCSKSRNGAWAFLPSDESHTLFVYRGNPTESHSIPPSKRRASASIPGFSIGPSSPCSYTGFHGWPGFQPYHQNPYQSFHLANGQTGL